MNKTVLVIITLALVATAVIIFTGGSRKDSTGAGEPQSIVIKDGVQYITINTQGGYFPQISDAQAGIPTKLIMKTSGTYNCSLSLVIRSIGFQKILPQTGETEIDLGIPKVGVPIQGVCSMGMYNFVINFS
ncbi:hypothetical protein HYZ82_00250 [Candidatus Nomurabacteria bacterium]|nr:hypothetical protein [Candidatus Nomurabacteria bacterium]